MKHSKKHRLIGRSRYETPVAPKDQPKANARRLERGEEYDFNPRHLREFEAALPAKLARLDARFLADAKRELQFGVQDMTRQQRRAARNRFQRYRT